MFHKLIYLMGERIRNPLIRPCLDELINTDFSSIEELESLQLVRLKKLLRHAKKHSIYYRDRLSKLDIDKLTLSDLKKLPLLSKREIYDNIDKIFNNPYGKNKIKSETSGSSGDPFIFFRSNEADAYTRAAQYRGYSWYGINPWDKNIYFWGFNTNWKQRIVIRLFDFFMNRYRIFSFDEKVLAKASKILKNCVYVEGYSSGVFTLSQYLESKNMTYRNIKLVKGTSEKVYDTYHKPANEVFGHKMVNEYGAAETGIIAFECPQGNMHIAMENVIVEVIDNKAVITNLHSDMSPIIRYELGDYLILDRVTECVCGRKHPVIKEVSGRIGKKIYGQLNSYSSFILYYIFKNIALLHGIELAYFGVQKSKGHLILDVIYLGDEETLMMSYIEEQTNNYFGTDMAVEVNFVKKVDQNNKKLKDFESYIE